MTITVKVVADSISHGGRRLTTMQLMYPRFIHAEFMTHRAFSRNASSSRAIPVAKIIDQVRNSPGMPMHWGQNQSGMQARQEIQHVGAAKDLWNRAARYASIIAEEMAAIGLHKQVANRIMEPFQFMHVVVTATDWDNFFELRDHPDAEPNIEVLAKAMKVAMNASQPVLRLRNRYSEASWHLPYVTQEERAAGSNDPFFLAKLSTARCARVSYMNHDGTTPVIEKDIQLHNDLVAARPQHASPTEHQGYPMPAPTQRCKNFTGWVQYREWVEALYRTAEATL